MRLDKHLIHFIILTTIASFVTGLPLYFFVKSLNLSVGPVVLLLVGLALVATGFLVRKRITSKSKKALANKDAVLAGLLQGTAIVPGISRSGVTLFALLSQGYSADLALKLSFLMSIPVVLAATAFDALQGFAFENSYLLALSAAAIVGYLMIGLLIRAAKRVDFSWFCWAFGVMAVAGALLA
jgi:undecaprenyl-diphosphatase